MTDETRRDFVASEAEKFRVCVNKLNKLVYADTEACKRTISDLLDELIAIEYGFKIADTKETGAVLTQCCYLVPLKHDLLVTKICHLTTNLLSRQQIVMNEGAETLTEYLIKALQTCQAWTFSDILRALAVILYENGPRLSQFHSRLLGRDGYMLQLAQAKEEDIVRGAMQCLENICIRINNHAYLQEEFYRACFDALLENLQKPKPPDRDNIIHARILISGLRGIHCIILATKTLSVERLGPLLAALKVYILFGLPGMMTVVSKSLVPTPLSKYDPTAKSAQSEHEATSSKAQPNGETNDSAAQKTTVKTANKKTKKRRGRGKKGGKGEDDTVAEVQTEVSQLSLTQTGQAAGATPTNTTAPTDATTLWQPWNKHSSSESDFSDTEGGQSAKLKSLYWKVRQCALGCLHACIKSVDRRAIFGYWSAFIPDTPTFSGPSLFTAILKDPSPKGRTGALAVLTALVDGSKQYLMAAEEADQYRNAPFTPFSVNLGHMVKEMHRCLMLSLVSETSSLATTQVIKCLAALIPNVPYHRLRPGLLSRLIKQLLPYRLHRDPNIRVAFLTAMGSISSVQAPMVEVFHILQGSQPTLPTHAATPGDPDPSRGPPRLSDSDPDPPPPTLSGIPSPHLSSGAQTPSLSDHRPLTARDGADMSWLVWLCLRNVSWRLVDGQDASLSGQTEQPLPVRLESLQVLAILAKNYFPLLRPCMPVIRDTILFCLRDKDPVLQLHGAKLLEENAAVTLQQSQNGKNPPDSDMMSQFWIQLLSGPLPNALQNVDYHAVKSTICDCLSNIGAEIFGNLPLDKRIMCVTLMLGLCGDPDHHVRASAVRTLGVFVLYPCLREDVSFVTDAATATIKGLSEQILAVRVKAAWSLGNISDALVLNRQEGDESFQADLSDRLLRNLFEAAVKASQDNDKVRSNAVRALGNLLRYIPEHSLSVSGEFSNTVRDAIQCLIKNITSGTVKVRWNACYAAGNMFKNSKLILQESLLTNKLHEGLCSVIQDCSNFKVRINAALALSICDTRLCYGSSRQFSTLWHSLVVALQSAQTVTDFAEYRYMDSLTEQICQTLIQFSTLSTKDDLPEITTALDGKYDLLRTYMDKYKQSLLTKEDHKQRCEDIHKARKHMEEFTKEGTLPNKSQTVTKFVTEILCLEKEEPVYHDSQMTSPPKAPTSGFLQTYD